MYHMCVCMFYEHGKIIGYYSSTTSEETLDFFFESSNQLNQAGREFMNIQFGFQNSCSI